MKRTEMVELIRSKIEEVLDDADGSLTYEELSNEASIEIIQLVEQYMIPKNTVELEHLNCTDNGWSKE